MRRGENPNPQLELFFEAAEDLYSNASLMLSKGEQRRLPITRPRTAQSYCHEFCGIVGVPFASLRFTIDARPLNLGNFLSSPCVVRASHSCQVLQSSQNSLQPALLKLVTSGMHSDVVLRVREAVFPAHKCLLMCRSPKFKAMFLTLMSESQTSEVFIDSDPELFDKLLKWIYVGSTLMPEEVRAVCELLMLADEYLMPDLKLRCEEELVAKINPENVVDLMVTACSLPLITDNLLRECKDVFVKQFGNVAKMQPHAEEMIGSVPGLMMELFQHFHKVTAKTRKRRVTFRINDGIVDTQDDVSTINSGYSSPASSYA